MISRSLQDPFDPHGALHHTAPRPSEGDLPASALDTHEARMARVVESSVVRAIFGGNDMARRRFLQMVGAGAAAEIIRSVFPFDIAKAIAAEQVKGIEKPDLQVGFIPITCATPIIMAEPMGFYAKHGLNAKVRRAAGWAMVRDWAINKEVDAAHMLSPMPLSITLGAGSQKVPYFMPAVENINGQAITLHKKYKDVKTAQDMKGFRSVSPLPTRCTTICCGIFWPRAASIRIRTCRFASSHHRRWSPI
jgi:nitrate/nitrite transport system substrate-binding protein